MLIRALPLPVLVLCLLSPAPLWAKKGVKRIGEVKYVSQQSYYVNLGSQNGLTVGDTIRVIRNKQLVGRLVVENMARLSSACRLLHQRSPIKQGDLVEAVVPAAIEKQGITKRTGQKKQTPLGSRTSRRRRRVARKKSDKGINRIRGRLSYQSLFLNDQTNANLDYRQMGLRSKITVDKFLGLPFELRFRGRTRSQHRSRVAGNSIDQNEFRHNLYEMGLVYRNANSPFEFGFGRILSPDIRGIGTIDGGLFSYKVNGHVRVGLTGGTQPSLRNSAFQTSEKKFGLFANFETGNYRAQRISTTAAFSGSYHGSTSSREFFYLQNNYSIGSTFSIYQSVEADLNRGWKNGSGQSSLQFSNFFLSTRYSPLDFFSLNFSYDARKAIRVFETRSIPDSLFDGTTRQGMHSGFTLRLPARIRLSGNFGLRFRSGVTTDTFSASSNLVVPQIFRTWSTLTARFSYFSSMFARGYRPNVNLRLPIMPGLVLDLGGGSYINQIGGQTSRSNWVETNGYYRINRWLFANFGYRLFFDDRLRSGRLFLETGVVF